MNDTYTLIVRLPADRDYLGTLELRDAKSRRLAGPFEVCGRADDTLARRHRNPIRNPLLPHGDMPFGEYRVKAGVAVDEVELEPRNGDAALADANGRFRFLIQGGGLRPMDDGLRLADSDLRELLRALGRLQGEICTCVVLKADAGRNKVPLATPAPAPARRETPPPATAAAPVPIMMSRTPRRSRLLMVFWLRALMGATGALVAMRSAFGSIAASPPPDPSGDLRSVLAARSSGSTWPAKPRFARGKLFAQMGGDYSQPEEETPAQQAPSEPAPEEQAPVQAPTEQAPAEPEEEQQAPAEPEQQAPAEQEQQTPAQQEQQEQPAPAEQEQQAPAEQEQQAPAEQEQQAPAEQEQQAPAEQEQQAPAEQEQQAPAQQEQQAPAEQQQAPAEQEQQAPAEQEQQAPAEQQQEQTPAETQSQGQLNDTEKSSTQAAQNPSLESAHEEAGAPFDNGHPGQVLPTPQAPVPAPSQQAEPQQSPAEQAPDEQTPDEEATPSQPDENPAEEPSEEQVPEQAPAETSPSRTGSNESNPVPSAPVLPVPAYGAPAAPASAVPQRGNLYVDPKSFDNYMRQAMQPAPVQKAPAYDPAKTDAEIKGIKQALDRLKTVSAANLARSAEWMKASNEATKDAWESGKNLTVDLLIQGLKVNAGKLDKNMQGEVDAIINATNPAEKKALQEAFMANAGHKEQLQKAFETLEYAHKGTDVLTLTDKNYHPADSGEEKTKWEKVNKQLENASDVLQMVAPGQTGLIKSYVDAGYDIWVQSVAVMQINSVNQGQTEYLNAVTTLTKRMQTLVDLKKKNGLPPQAGD